MLGLPTEDMDDIENLVRYINNLIKMGSKQNKVKLSINPFIPKPHTPFQWESFQLKEIKSKIKYLNSRIKISSLKIENPKKALIQYVLSMGGQKLGDVLDKFVE